MPRSVSGFRTRHDFVQFSLTQNLIRTLLDEVRPKRESKHGLRDATGEDESGKKRDLTSQTGVVFAWRILLEQPGAENVAFIQSILTSSYTFFPYRCLVGAGKK